MGPGFCQGLAGTLRGRRDGCMQSRLLHVVGVDCKIMGLVRLPI
jgi:hypothetical protein